jgi:hypothetical protein
MVWLGLLRHAPHAPRSSHALRCMQPACCRSVRRLPVRAARHAALAQSASSPAHLRALALSERSHARIVQRSAAALQRASHVHLCVRYASQRSNSLASFHVHAPARSIREEPYCAYPSTAAHAAPRARAPQLRQHACVALPLMRRSPRQQSPPPPCAPRGRLLCAQASPALGAPCSSRRRRNTLSSA